MPPRVPSDATPEPYTGRGEIPTPSLVVDVDVMRRNVERIDHLASDHGVSVRSHTKVHKTPALAHFQADVLGAGIYCQTVGEAEVMAHCGHADIRISNQIVGDAKIRSVLALAESLDFFSVAVDGAGNVEPLQAAAERHDVTVNVDLELDVGRGRAGVPPDEAAREVASDVRDASHLRLVGLLAHDSHLPQRATRRSDLERHCSKAMAPVTDLVDDLREDGSPIDDVVTGCTRTAEFMAGEEVVTELDPGRYLFNDGTTIGTVGERRCALTVLATVTSRPTADRAIVDAGYKTFGGRDQIPIPLADGVEVNGLSAEHGILDVGGYGETLSVGDVLEFVPLNSHAAVGANRSLVGVEDGTVKHVWEVLGRGK